MRRVLSLLALVVPAVACATHRYQELRRPILPGSAYLVAYDADDVAETAAKCREIGPAACARNAEERRFASWLLSYPDEATFDADRKQALEHALGQVEAHAIELAFEDAREQLRPVWRAPMVDLRDLQDLPDMPRSPEGR